MTGTVVEVCGVVRARRPPTSICRGNSKAKRPLTCLLLFHNATTVQQALFNEDLPKTNSMLSRASVILVTEHCVLREEIFVPHLCLV